MFSNIRKVICKSEFLNESLFLLHNDFTIILIRIFLLMQGVVEEDEVCVAVQEGTEVIAPEVAAAVKAEVLAEEERPRCPQPKNWMLNLTLMSTRSTSEVNGGQQWRAFTIIWLSCLAVVSANCCHCSPLVTVAT